MALSGVANEVLLPSQLDTPLDFDAMAAAGSGLGSGGFVIYDEGTCAVAVARAYSRFLYVESCGQCAPCKLGTGDITASLEALEQGDLQAADLGDVQERLRTVTDARRCYLPVEEVKVVGSVLNAFDGDVQAHLSGACALRHGLPVPKIADFDEATGRFTFDDRQARKRPDWTYEVG
jgi:NADH:ubiquinone oxidoreductase subunit F (NADH-binding)